MQEQITLKQLGLIVFLSLPQISSQLQLYEVVQGWKQLDYAFRSPRHRERALQSGEFIPKNNCPVGIKIHPPSKRIFIAVARWFLGVPSTLNFIKFGEDERKSDGSPPLQPYPSWEMQEIGNCNALQYVQSMEIDEFGRMWVFDHGRINTFAENPEEHINLCPPKLLIIDLNNDKIIHKHVFPENVISPTANFINDITVGCEDKIGRRNCWAYLSESGEAKVVIYNLEEDRSWFVQHNRSMDTNPGGTTFPILGQNYTFPVAKIDGIVLSPKDMDHDRIFYAPLSSFSMYSVPTSVLKSSKNGDILKEREVEVITANRRSQSDGITMDSEGRLIYGVLQHNEVAYMNITNSKKEISLVQNDVDLQWPNSFSFDDNGYLYALPVRIQHFFHDTMDWNDVNYRIVRTFLGSRSYMYSSSRNTNKLLQSNNANAETFINVQFDKQDNSFTSHLNSEKILSNLWNHNIFQKGGNRNKNTNDYNVTPYNPFDLWLLK